MEAERVYKELIWQDRDRMSGAVCFYGTRIPVSMFFGYLEAGETIERFSADHRIPIEKLHEVLELASAGIETFLQAAA